jgi:hypothetical protein
VTDAGGPDSLRPMRIPRSFPPPWKLVEIPGGFRVQDANSRALAYVYYHSRSDGGEEEFLTYLEALGVAEQIVRSAERSAAGLADSDQDPTVLE